MKAYIEVYNDGNIIKIYSDDDRLIEQYEISEIRVEMPRGYITARDPQGTIPLETMKN